MRMGGGTVEGDPSAQLTFVTTGYLVKYMAFCPEQLAKYSHIIIDEVHERSVDSDVLCYLAKKLLSTSTNLKLILMSATIHTTLYKDYFPGHYGDLECLSVGKRRFENNIIYADDIVSNTGTSATVGLPKIIIGSAKRIVEFNIHSHAGEETFIKAQYNLAKQLILLKAQRGTAVLVFVAGINDINEFIERFEDEVDYKLIAIHSDIPFEDQEQAFVQADPNKVKVIVGISFIFILTFIIF